MKSLDIVSMSLHSSKREVLRRTSLSSLDAAISITASDEQSCQIGSAVASDQFLIDLVGGIFQSTVNLVIQSEQAVRSI